MSIKISEIIRTWPDPGSSYVFGKSYGFDYVTWKVYGGKIYRHGVTGGNVIMCKKPLSISTQYLNIISISEYEVE